MTETPVKTDKPDREFMGSKNREGRSVLSWAWLEQRLRDCCQDPNALPGSVSFRVLSPPGAGPWQLQTHLSQKPQGVPGLSLKDPARVLNQSLRPGVHNTPMKTWDGTSHVRNPGNRWGIQLPEGN